MTSQRGPTDPPSCWAVAGSKATALRLPVAAVEDFVEGAAVRLGNGAQRAVRWVAGADQVRDVAVGWHAEDRARGLLIAHRGVAGADAEVGRGEHHGVRGLAQVVLVDDPAALVVGLRNDQREGGGRPGDVAGAAPDGG